MKSERSMARTCFTPPKKPSGTAFPHFQSGPGPQRRGGRSPVRRATTYSPRADAEHRSPFCLATLVGQCDAIGRREPVPSPSWRRPGTSKPGPVRRCPTRGRVEGRLVLAPWSLVPDPGKVRQRAGLEAARCANAPSSGPRETVALGGHRPGLHPRMPGSQRRWPRPRGWGSRPPSHRARRRWEAGWSPISSSSARPGRARRPRAANRCDRLPSRERAHPIRRWDSHAGTARAPRRDR